MPIASWASDAAGLTWLILGTFAFIAVILFRNEIKDLFGRMSNLRIKRMGTEIGADLTKPGQHLDEDEQQAESIDRDEGPESAQHDPAPAEVAEVESEDPMVVRSTMFQSYMEGDESLGDAQFERLRSLEGDRSERKRDEIRKHAGRYMGGIDTSALDMLRAFENDDEVSSFAHYTLGQCLRHVGKNVESAEEFEKAIAKAKTSTDRADAAVERSISLADSGQADLAISELGGCLAKDPEAEVQAQIWSGLAQIYKKTEAKELEAVALHQVAANVGNDPDKWFDAGYAYSHPGSNALYLLALHCYQTALKLDSNQNYATNNMGVLLNLLSLPIHAIAQYRESAAVGLTLSMANIADRYLEEGFADEAKQLLQAAASDDNPHKRVATVTADMESRRTAEEEKLSKLKGDGARASEFMIEHTSARWRQTVDLNGDWTWGDDQVTTVEVKDGGIDIRWKMQPPLPHRRFVGKLEGAALTGKFEKEAEKLGSTSTVWVAGDYGYGILSDDGNAIRVVELGQDRATYFVLSRLSKE